MLAAAHLWEASCGRSSKLFDHHRNGMTERIMADTVRTMAFSLGVKAFVSLDGTLSVPEYSGPLTYEDLTVEKSILCHAVKEAVKHGVSDITVRAWVTEAINEEAVETVHGR